MAHDLKKRAPWGLLLGQALILVTCGAWMAFALMAITHTLPVASDYFDRLRLRLIFGDESLSTLFHEPLVVIAGVLVAVFAGLLVVARFRPSWLVHPPPVDPGGSRDEVGRPPRSVGHPLDPVGDALDRPQQPHWGP